MRWSLTALAAGAAVAYAWWATSFLPFSWPDRIAVGIPGLAIVALAGFRYRRPRLTLQAWFADIRFQLRHPPPRRSTGAIWVWGALLGALVVWELIEFFQSPRRAHPTLSSMSEALLAFHPIRMAVFLLWVALGVDFMRR